MFQSQQLPAANKFIESWRSGSAGVSETLGDGSIPSASAKIAKGAHRNFCGHFSFLPFQFSVVYLFMTTIPAKRPDVFYTQANHGK